MKIQKTHYCPSCEKIVEKESDGSSPVYCNHCGRIINLAQIKEWSEEKFKKRKKSE